MKVAIYTIALNEEQFVQRWYESAKDADYLLIADTGSQDGTVELAKSLGINVVSISVNPWRFDVARNEAMTYLPDDIDYCISLDMDEVITSGWRKPLEELFAAGVTRPKYKHIWSWNDDGTPGLEFGYDHIHARHGYVWKHPVHECLYAVGIDEVAQFTEGLETHHHPDPTKSRSQYLPLLKLSVEEDPLSDRNAFYYARELFFYNKYEEAKEQFKRHLSLPTATWAPERAASYRYLAKVDEENAEQWLSLAISESPGRREALVEYALYLYHMERWQECYNVASKALDIREKPLDYLCEEFAWNELPFDLAAISAYNIGLKDEALIFGTAAFSINPSDPRLENNLWHYQNN